MLKQRKYFMNQISYEKKFPVFGDKALQVKDGDKFIAIRDSVEGRTVVYLVPESEVDAWRIEVSNY